MSMSDNDFLEAEAMDDIKLLLSDINTPDEAVETLLLHGYPTKNVFDVVGKRFDVVLNTEDEKIKKDKK